MMRYMMMVKATADYEAGMPPSPKLMEGMGKLVGEMMQAGILLAAEGLQPSSQGVRLKHARGERLVTDGPFAETKELIGGYAILRAKSKQEAIALADRMLAVHIDAGIPECEVEIRPLFDPPDAGSVA
jgi:hypothetical protein